MSHLSVSFSFSFSFWFSLSLSIQLSLPFAVALSYQNLERNITLSYYFGYYSVLGKFEVLIVIILLIINWYLNPDLLIISLLRQLYIWFMFPLIIMITIIFENSYLIPLFIWYYYWFYLFLSDFALHCFRLSLDTFFFHNPCLVLILSDVRVDG